MCFCQAERDFAQRFADEAGHTAERARVKAEKDEEAIKSSYERQLQAVTTELEVLRKQVTDSNAKLAVTVQTASTQTLNDHRHSKQLSAICTDQAQKQSSIETRAAAELQQMRKRFARELQEERAASAEREAVTAKALSALQNELKRQGAQELGWMQRSAEKAQAAADTQLQEVRVKAEQEVQLARAAAEEAQTTTAKVREQCAAKIESLQRSLQEELTAAKQAAKCADEQVQLASERELERLARDKAEARIAEIESQAADDVAEAGRLADAATAEAKRIAQCEMREEYSRSKAAIQTAQQQAFAR